MVPQIGLKRHWHKTEGHDDEQKSVFGLAGLRYRRTYFWHGRGSGLHWRKTGKTSQDRDRAGESDRSKGASRQNYGEELEREKGGSGLRYSFDIRHGSITQEVGVDAQTGKVLENKKEGPNPD